MNLFDSDMHQKFEKYRKTHGEVEARNVQTRLEKPHKTKAQKYNEFIESKVENEAYIPKSELAKAEQRAFSLWERLQESKNQNNTALKIAYDKAQEKVQKLKEELADKLKSQIPNTFKKDALPHPKETSDVDFSQSIVVNKGDLKNGVVQSRELESKFLNARGEIDFNALEGEAVELPKAVKFRDFKEDILKNENSKQQSHNNIIYTTPIGDIAINLGYAYNHFLKAGNGKQNRFNLTGALTQILDNPLFVTKDKKGAYYFYKPFKDKKGARHLVSISVEKSGKIKYKTSYEASSKRLEQMIKIHDLVYLKG